MSQPSRPQARGPAQRRRRDLKFEAVQALEERCLLAPVLSVAPRLAAFTPAANLPTGINSGGVVVTLGQADTGFLSAAPFTSVSELTPISSFGGDIVRIRSGPGGVFGRGVYAISRGAGENGLPAGSTQNSTTLPPTVNGAVNRPGVIYRVDPATGKTSVFFDLNTVVPQLDANKSTTAANSVGAATGLVNWYDITFDPEGYFDGKPSMFVASVDRSDPAKNAVYRIAPDGTFMGAFVQMTDGQSALKFNVNPSAILVPPVEDQTFLRGLLAGSGISSTNGTFAALFFNANAYTPGQNISTSTLPVGVSQTGLTEGLITGLTAANPDYLSRVYSTFTDFGTPAAGGIPATQGLSGVQGINGELLINGGLFPTGFQTSTDSTITDKAPAYFTDFRRFEDIAFDQYGYFTQGTNLNAGASTAATNAGAVGGTGAGGGSGTGVGQNLGAGISGTIIVNNTVTSIALPPASAGNLFVADLGTGLSVPVTVPNSNPAITLRVPVQGPEQVTVDATGNVTITPTGVGLGGRIVRITPDGQVRNFAENFHTSNNTDASGFALSSLSITFSADGTTLYAADDDGIWQFKTTASLAGSTSGSLTGLNDLRSLGVPYDGAGTAVAVLDTGVDGTVSSFRGRVANGTNVFTNTYGNNDTSTAASGTTTTGGGTGGTGTTTGGAQNQAPLPGPDGHGTPVAGVVAQYVPQATLVPVNIFAPFLSVSLVSSGTTGGTGTGTGTGTGGTGTTTLSGNSNAMTSSQYFYKGLDWIAKHPFVNDPVRPGQVDRVIATVMGFGTTNTYNAETGALKNFPQITIALKNQLKKFRHLGIAPIAATGQFGQPLGANATGTTTGGTTTTTGTTGNNSADNANLGDVNGISLPAILNEVVSVTGSYSYPFQTGPLMTPNSPPAGVANDQLLGVPVLVFGGTISPVGTGSGTTTGGGTTATTANLATVMIAPDLTAYTDRILGSVNRNITTDYAAPALDVPTFRRNLIASTASTGGTGGTGGTTTTTTTTLGQFNHMTFTDAGTSLSSAQVAGAFALVSSALNYWSNLNQTGVTSDAYLTQPVGVNTLNFGPHAFIDLSKYNNPDGINSILQWTAVPATDPNDGLSLSTPKELIGSTAYKTYSRMSVSNAIAAIEGTVALQYLIAHNDLQYIDANKNGIITAQELQTFVNNAATMGMPEAGAMARLLGGTARIGNPDGTATTTVSDTSSTTIGYGQSLGYTLPVNGYVQQPDQPDILQRRFNFFDYVADGNLNGSVTISQFNMLAHTLLPVPDAFTINDRQRASVNTYLVAPTTLRNTHDLLHIQPKYQFIAKGVMLKYRNISPAQFHVDRGVQPGTTFPIYTLFDPAVRASAPASTTGTGSSSTTTGSGSTTTSIAVTGSVSDPTGTTTSTGSSSTATTPATTPATTTTTTTAAGSPVAAPGPSELTNGTTPTTATTTGATAPTDPSAATATATTTTSTPTTTAPPASVTKNVAQPSSNATPLLVAAPTSVPSLPASSVPNRPIPAPVSAGATIYVPPTTSSTGVRAALVARPHSKNFFSKLGDQLKKIFG